MQREESGTPILNFLIGVSTLVIILLICTILWLLSPSGLLKENENSVEGTTEEVNFIYE